MYNKLLQRKGIGPYAGYCIMISFTVGQFNPIRPKAFDALGSLGA